MTRTLDDDAVQRHKDAATLAALAEVLAAHPASQATAERLQALADRTAAGAFRVVLLGAFSTGKTTLVDALMGQRLLPVAVNPCTAVVTEITHGDATQVELEDADGGTRTVSQAAFRDGYHLDDDVDELSAGAELNDRFGHLRVARLQAPAELLSHGVALVDTPGLDDDPVRTARTLEALREADAVVFVTAAPSCLGHLERSLLADHLAPLGLTNLFLVITMADLLPALTDDPEGAEADLLRRARRVFGPLAMIDGRDRFDERVFLVDGRGALAARWDAAAGAPTVPAAGALEATGLPAFESALARFLAEERAAARTRQLLDAVGAVHAESERRRALATASLDASAATLRARLDALAPELTELAALAERVDQRVHTFVADQAAALSASVTTFLDETAEALPEGVRSVPLGALARARLLTPSGREAVAAELEAGLAAWLDTRTEVWRSTHEASLEGALDALRDELAHEAERLGALEATVRGRLQGWNRPDVRPWSDADPVDPAERWLSVAVGAVLLSPGTVAAGWNEGLRGALKGAVGRLTARAAVVAFGTLAGPVGWMGLAAYALSDVVIVAATGGEHLTQLQDRLAHEVGQHLHQGRADAADRASLELRALLEPWAATVAEAARADVNRVRDDLDAVVVERERLEDDQRSVLGAWDTVQAAIARALEALGHA